MRRLVVAVVVALLCAACYSRDPNVTPSGQGRPIPTVEFPETADPGSVETAALHVTNPGPGAIEVLIVSFSRVGKAAGASLPDPLVDVAFSKDESAVVRVTPTPKFVSRDHVIYQFWRPGRTAPVLPEGESMTIEFDIEVPSEPGVAANSVIVYDGDQTDRAKGILLETTVEG